MIFVFDGDYWGYEFFDNGLVLDHFVQDREEAKHWFPDKDCLGGADILADKFSFLSQETLQKYLVQDPEWAEVKDSENARQLYSQLRNARNIKIQPDDEFLPFDECFVLDFLRYLGVRVELQNDYVTFLSSKWQTFWVSGQNTHKAWKKRYSKPS